MSDKARGDDGSQTCYTCISFDPIPERDCGLCCLFPWNIKKDNKDVCRMWEHFLDGGE